MKLDTIDYKILDILQDNADISNEELAKRVGSSKTPVWNRIQKMKKAGIIKKNIALLDHNLLGFNNIFYVIIRTSEHDPAWIDSFLHAVQNLAEIQEAHRLAGDIDYILKVCVENAEKFDVFYKKLVHHVKIFSVSSSLSMETLKSTTMVPFLDKLDK